jgi:hypothetical protein
LNRYLHWISICCIFTAFLFAEEEINLPSADPFVSSLVKTQNMISTIVDSVSVISGEWLHSETDFVILGPEPLILNRLYSGDHSHGETLGYNWDFNRPHRLIADAKENGTKHFKVRARLNHSSGIATIHEARPNDKALDKEVVEMPLSQTRGLTNCCGEISAKTNLHNTVIHYHHDKKKCTAITGSGQTTHYRCYKRRDLTEFKPANIGIGHYKTHFLDYYYPIYEKKPNGNTIHFEKNRIVATNASKSVVYGTMEFNSVG